MLSLFPSATNIWAHVLAFPCFTHSHIRVHHEETEICEPEDSQERGKLLSLQRRHHINSVLWDPLTRMFVVILQKPRLLPWKPQYLYFIRKNAKCHNLHTLSSRLEWKAWIKLSAITSSSCELTTCWVIFCKINWSLLC